MTANITANVTLVRLVCPTCGGVFAIAAAYHDEAKMLGGFQRCWSCPYCKASRGFGKSAHEVEKEKLQAELVAARRDKNNAEIRAGSLEKEAEHFRKSRDGVKGVLARERKRVGNGVCPCCSRHFVNLMRHMKTKHPEHQS